MQKCFFLVSVKSGADFISGPFNQNQPGTDNTVNDNNDKKKKKKKKRVVGWGGGGAERKEKSFSGSKDDVIFYCSLRALSVSVCCHHSEIEDLKTD